MNYIIKQLEKEQMKQNILSIRTGDTVEVKIWVVEVSKKRLQAFEGIVISVRNRNNLNFTFTIRKISNNEGVERAFKFHSPIIDSVVVKRHGSVRRAKLYYLRNLAGKSARIKERLN